MFAQKRHGISKLLLAEMRMLRINGDPFKSVSRRAQPVGTEATAEVRVDVNF